MGETNADLIRHAEDTLQETDNTLDRIHMKVQEIKEIGKTNLEVLDEQWEQIGHINTELDHVNEKLGVSSGLLNVFSLNIGNYFNGNKNSVVHEQEEIIINEIRNLSEVYEDQTYDHILRAWKTQRFVYCSNTTKEVHKSFRVHFYTSPTEKSKWVIDYSGGAMDGEGWSYAFSYDVLNKGNGIREPNIHHNVRRRKWKMNAQRRNSEKVAEVESKSNNNQLPASGKPYGYVGRKHEQPRESGFVSTFAKGNEELDEKSKKGLERIEKKDKENDQKVEVIGHAIDDIHGIAKEMNQKVRMHNKEITLMAEKVETAVNKQIEVNNHLEKLLK